LATQIPFIDCHHHIWDPGMGTYPWLRAEAAIPFRYGDYSALKTAYLPADYARDAANFDVVGHVTMEGEWDDTDPVGETRWLAGIFEAHPAYVGHVARAILHAPDADAQLAGHAAHAFVKGIRHKPTTADHPSNVEPGAPGSLSDPAWRSGYAKLASHGLHFELQAPWWHVDELCDLVAAHPETPVVINHLFLPAERTPEALNGWRAALKRAAGLANTTLKISGMGIAGRPWQLADHHRLILDAIDIFGPSRCMIASNFPVDRLTGSFETIIHGYHVATLRLYDHERADLFHDTAVRVYRLPIAPLNASEDA